MFRLKKDPEKDFTVLCLTDPQMHGRQWAVSDPALAVLLYTVRTLVMRHKPDLIVVAGDIAYAGHEGCDLSHDNFADLMESFGIPWAFVWGNHDDQGGPDFVRRTAERYLQKPHCLFEAGDVRMGCGNYVIAIEEDDRIVSALLMMDSHDSCYDVKPYIDENGVECVYDSSLNELQRVWYKEQVDALCAAGCEDTALIMHIPFSAYRDAYMAAYRDPSREALDALPLAQTHAGAPCWNDAYKDSFGAMHENVSSYGHDDGIFEMIRASDSTRHVLVGHDHVNNWSIRYRDVLLTYITKCGMGDYADREFNGGTIVRIASDGIADVRHDFVDIRAIY